MGGGIHCLHLRTPALPWGGTAVGELGVGVCEEVTGCARWEQLTRSRKYSFQHINGTRCHEKMAWAWSWLARADDDKRGPKQQREALG